MFRIISLVCFVFLANIIYAEQFIWSGEQKTNHSQTKLLKISDYPDDLLSQNIKKIEQQYIEVQRKQKILLEKQRAEKIEKERALAIKKAKKYRLKIDFNLSSSFGCGTRGDILQKAEVYLDNVNISTLKFKSISSGTREIFSKDSDLIFTVCVFLLEELILGDV